MKKIFQNKLTILLLATLVLIALFILLKPDSSSAPTSNSKQQNEQKAASNVTKTFVLNIKEDQVTGDVIMKVNERDSVVINIASEISDELHLHGYDQSVDLEPGTKEQLKFVANQTGRFEIELHELEQAVAALEVQPKL